MDLKRYQERVLERLEDWFRCMDETNGSPAATWEQLHKNVDSDLGEHHHREDSSKNPIPHICLKVPTGGGKTLLAAEALVKSNRPTGLVLWMVPTNAIYNQTKKALWSREHLYRQTLERASDGKVKVLEKDENLQKDDIANYLCVMLVSLQAANRRNNKQFLKMYQEAGKYSTFFPELDDQTGEAQLLENHPDLAQSENGKVLHTLGNVIKICRPIIVLDEAHKAFGQNIDELWVNDFNPSLVLELSATPDPARSNILIDISGASLKEEEMIKLPIHVTGHGKSKTWRNVLTEVQAQLQDLSSMADMLHADSGRYIRPMALIRVSRTGKDQRGHGNLHAEDVREHLLNEMGIPADKVRVQSSDTKELEGEDLMSEHCRVRWIITKDALKEGWDCSNAYVLALLDNTSARITVTQMMGRILRQPRGKLTKIEQLNQCYVHCSDVGVDAAVTHVKKELEDEGFGDLGSQVIGKNQTSMKTVGMARRSGFKSKPAHLPRVLFKDGSPIDYSKHILADLDWDKLRAPRQNEWENLGKMTPIFGSGTAIVDLGEDEITGSKNLQGRTLNNSSPQGFDIAWYTRQLGDTIPNPWQAARIIKSAKDSLENQGHDDNWIHNRRASFLNNISQHLKQQIESQAETIFKQKLSSGEITFNMEMPFELPKWYELSVPTSEAPRAYQKSLFEPIHTHDWNNLEKRYALYLDRGEDERTAAIDWWHRIAARSPEDYRLQGWRKDYVYPDFVALSDGSKIWVHETKGDHLAGNEDTKYKERLLKCLEDNFNSHGTMAIKGRSKKAEMSADFKIIFEKDVPE